MFDLGTQELIVIFLVAFLVFGPKKLPELGRTIGRGMNELKKAMRGVKDSIDEASEGVSEEFQGAKSDIEDAVNKGIESHFSFKDSDKEDVKKADSTQEPQAPEKKRDDKKESDNG